MNKRISIVIPVLLAMIFAGLYQSQPANARVSHSKGIVDVAFACVYYTPGKSRPAAIEYHVAFYSKPSNVRIERRKAKWYNKTASVFIRYGVRKTRRIMKRKKTVIRVKGRVKGRTGKRSFSFRLKVPIHQC